MNFAMVGTIKHCLTGLIVAFLGGAAYIFELRLGNVYRDVAESRQEISFLKQKIKDLKSNFQANQMELTEIKRRFVESETILNHTMREKEKEANIIIQDLKKVFDKERKERQLQIDNIEKKCIQDRERIVANFVQEEIPKINKIIENERKERQLHINNIRNTGSVFTRWGRNDCTKTSTLVYKGYAGGSHYSHKGAASNFLCLPENPQWGDRKATKDLAFVYGTEYESNLFGGNAHQQDVPCSVCQVEKGSFSIMIPARTTCYTGWTMQYKGYLGAGHHNHNAATEYICIDESIHLLPGGIENKDGKLIYPVVSKCGSLRCHPYIDNKPLTCIVCSK